MIIELRKSFKKDLYKLPKKQQEHFYKRLALFEDDPFDPILNNHQLSGNMKNVRSINVTGDIRAIYEEIGKDKVLFLTIASHSKLYD